jgi:amino acid transporter
MDRCGLAGRADAHRGEVTMPLDSKQFAYVAAGCAAILVVLTLTMCGLAALVRQYREFTVPLSLVFFVLAVFFGGGAYARLRRR